MLLPTNNIVRSAQSNKKSLNILSFICDGYFDSMLCNALPQHKFYAPLNDSKKPEGWNFTLCPQPPNLYYIPNFQQSNIASKINFDLAICHDRTSQYETAQQVVHALHINLIIMEHITSVAHLDMIGMIPLLKRTKNDVNVFVKNMAESFKIEGAVIPYGIPKLNSTNNKNQVLVFNAADDTVQNIQPYIKTPIKQYDTNTLTESEYHKVLEESKFYFNLEAELSRLQLPTLYAMSAGCVVISMSSPAVEDVITHMENGIIINNMEDLINIWNKLDSITTSKISKNAIQHIADNYDSEVFATKWNEILNNTSNKTYIR